jgi:hypothetical protein
MNYVIQIGATLILSVIAKCGGPPPSTPSSSSPAKEPCEQSGIGYAPVGKIAKMEQVPVAQKRPYGTHVLIDAGGNIQWVLQSSNLNLDAFADDGHWYRVDGTRAADRSDLFVVCAVSTSP